MATVKQYAKNLWGVHKTICAKMGLNVQWGTSEIRTAVLANDVMLATLVKILVDKGLITDAELNAAYSAVSNATFPALPPVVPNTLDGEVIPDPDLGA